MKNFLLLILLVLFTSSCGETRPGKEKKDLNESPNVFPYGDVPRDKPNMPLSAAMKRVYEGTYTGL